MKIHTKIFVVPPSAIDKRNHVNNLTYLQWCLDAAEKHWNDVAPKNFQENYVWYVINHNINYKAASFEGEKLELTTWIAKNEGVKSDRHYKIIRLSDQKIIIEATTTWCLINEKTLRPTKITEEISTLFE
tara:strand:- start:1001 stop:1390 length:390 start_codon:yes stop_codon:yes gene_type:complete